jgi:hypothetical protein
VVCNLTRGSSLAKASEGVIIYMYATRNETRMKQ